jgi:hypothetical protein
LKKLTSRVPLKGILVTQPTVYMTNWHTLTVTLGILSMLVHPPVISIEVSVNLSTSQIQEKILQSVSLIQFTHRIMNLLP